MAGNVKAVTDGTVMVFDGRDLKEAWRRDPDFATRVLRHLFGQALSFEGHVQADRSCDAAARLAGVLLALARVRQPTRVPLSQTALAEIAGMRRETACRLLLLWKGEGLVLCRNGCFVVLDARRLARIASASVGE